MKRIYFLIFTVLITSIQAQFSQYGSEINSKAVYKYGRFEANIAASDKERYATSFFLYDAQNNGTSIKFDIHKTQGSCYALDQRFYKEAFLPFLSISSKYVIEWTPSAIKCFVNDQLLLEAAISTEYFTKPMKVGFTLWAPYKSKSDFKTDTTLSEISTFNYYEYQAPNFNLVYSDEFEMFNTGFWNRSTETYPENSLQNDTSLMIVETGKLQMIGMSYKIKSLKRFFKRESSQDPIPQIATASYATTNSKPTLVLTFSDTVYNPDKNVKYFELNNNKILKSKLKSDYKTVLLLLEKPLTLPASVRYYPSRGRFRKPQIVTVQ